MSASSRRKECLSGQADSRVPLACPPLCAVGQSHTYTVILCVPPLPKLAAVLPPVSLSITVVIGSVATDGLGAFRLHTFLFSLFCSSS